jgi:Calpain family cysteine protease.
VGSYEGLEGGFWADAIQSFTGGVVERIRIKEENKVTENLFDIMHTSLSKGSSLCGIIKKVHLCHTAKVILDPLYVKWTKN